MTTQPMKIGCGNRIVPMKGVVLQTERGFAVGQMLWNILEDGTHQALLVVEITDMGFLVQPVEGGVC